MELSLGEIKLLVEPLNKVLTFDLPIKTSWKLTKISKILSEEVATIEDQRIKLVKKYGEEQEDQNVQVPKENFEDFLTEFNELLSEKQEFDFESISIDELGDDVKISPIQLQFLDKIFV